MRSDGARSTGSSRRYSMKPVGLPMGGSGKLEVERSERSVSANARRIAGVFFEGGHDGFVTGEALRLRAIDTGEHALVVLRHHFDELRQIRRPPVEDRFAANTLRVVDVLLDHRLHFGDFLAV